MKVSENEGQYSKLLPLESSQYDNYSSPSIQHNNTFLNPLTVQHLNIN